MVSVEDRFKKAEKNDFLKAEKWNGWQTDTEVKVIYNADDDEIHLVCIKDALLKVDVYALEKSAIVIVDDP